MPVAYGHREVWIRGYVHEVVIGCGGGIIARPPRSYERDDMVFDPIHYLPLLEQKIAALDQAAPLAGWELPDGRCHVNHRVTSLWAPTPEIMQRSSLAATVSSRRRGIGGVFGGRPDGVGR